MAKRTGKYTISFDQKPVILGYASVAGKKEGEGPLGKEFDMVYDDITMGRQSWEKAESDLVKASFSLALEKAATSAAHLDCIFAGDLLNQCMGSTFGLKDMDVAFVGLYGACSTMAESLCIGSVFLDSGAARQCACVTSSHFCSSERQFRYPLEYGGQRTPTAQWTVTGSGTVILASSGAGPVVNAVTFGKIADYGINDINNMGSAMAPAAAQTIKAFLDDTKTCPADYDMIITGDLGSVGSQLLHELLLRDSIDIVKKHADCGNLIFSADEQDVHAGGSGCGCSASVFCSYILNRLTDCKINNILFCATGALMSPTSFQQGESIPAIAHLLHISNP